MDFIPEPLMRLWSEAMTIWVAGGWAMWAIAVTALVMFGLGSHVATSLAGRGFASGPESTWRRTIALHSRLPIPLPWLAGAIAVRCP